jgi:hypothetical protein
MIQVFPLRPIPDYGDRAMLCALGADRPPSSAPLYGQPLCLKISI